MYDTVLVAN